MNELCIKLLLFIPAELFVWNIYWTITNPLHEIYIFDWVNWFIIILIVLYVRRYLKKCKMWKYDT